MLDNTQSSSSDFLKWGSGHQNSLVGSNGHWLIKVTVVDVHVVEYKWKKGK